MGRNPSSDSPRNPRGSDDNTQETIVRVLYMASACGYVGGAAAGIVWGPAAAVAPTAVGGAANATAELVKKTQTNP